jgi:hypothetical protein
MASYSVGSQADLTAALAGASPIDITITGSFAITEVNIIASGMVVTIASDAGGPYTLSRSVYGHLLHVSSGGSLEITNLILDGSTDPVSSTGRILWSAGTLTLNNTVVCNNYTLDDNNSGTIYIENHSTFTMNGGEVYGCSTTGRGSGIYCAGDASVPIRDAAIHDHHASGIAGGIYCSDATITNTSFYNNSTDTQGGGVYLIYSTISNSSVYNNTAGTQGGGVFGRGLTITDTSITGNTAPDAGGVHLSSYNNIINGATIIDSNTATQNGGGVYLTGAGTYTIDGTTAITNNTATLDGGGIYLA